ncbi:hypothetical protein P3T39_007414 [Kitasatospora sp. GP82]|nr:hypothetical protein [Kitasatospora sp. GP82]
MVQTVRASPLVERLGRHHRLVGVALVAIALTAAGAAGYLIIHTWRGAVVAAYGAGAWAFIRGSVKLASWRAGSLRRRSPEWRALETAIRQKAAVRQQPKHQLLYPTPGLDPREPPRDPAHQALERLLPTGRVYAVTCGHRMIFCLHTPMISGGRTRLRSGPRRQHHSLRLEYQ